MGESSFSTVQRTPAAPKILQQISRPKETGAGILGQLLGSDLAFYELHKTNKWSPHPVMGALYGDLIFHLGAGSRRTKFKTDRAQYGLDGTPFKDRFRYAINDTQLSDRELSRRSRDAVSGTGISRAGAA